MTIAPGSSASSADATRASSRGRDGAPDSCSSRCGSATASEASTVPRAMIGRPSANLRPGVACDAVPAEPSNDAPYRMIDDVSFGEGVIVQSFTNLYGCSIGEGTRVGTFVEVQRGARIGAR